MSDGDVKTAPTAMDDAALVLTRRAQRKVPGFHVAEEINLVPYMDVMVNLIIFLLVTISAFLPLGMLSIFPFSVSTSPAPTPQEDKPELTFSVVIDANGFTIAGFGGIMPPILKKADGTYDYEALAQKTVEVKKLFPNETQVILAAQRDVRYEVLVKTMDTLRNDGDKLLFPNVQLSPGMMKAQ
jgi:biopolymer transport protein ExbD